MLICQTASWWMDTPKILGTAPMAMKFLSHIGDHMIEQYLFVISHLVYKSRARIGKKTQFIETLLLPSEALQ